MGLDAGSIDYPFALGSGDEAHKQKGFQLRRARTEMHRSFDSALEVFAANGSFTRFAQDDKA